MEPAQIPFWDKQFFGGSAASKGRAITVHQQDKTPGRFPLREFYTHPILPRMKSDVKGWGPLLNTDGIYIIVDSHGLRDNGRERVLLPPPHTKTKSHVLHIALSSEKVKKSHHLVLRGVVVKDLHRRREGGVWLFIWLIFTPTFLALLEQKSSISHCFM